MSTRGRLALRVNGKPQANPKKRKYRAPDGSKHPDTITTELSVDNLINALYQPGSVDRDTRRDVRDAVEEFTRILTQSLLKSARADRSRPEEESNGKIARGYHRRVGAQEIWSAFVEHESLKPFAFRFLELGLVPAEHLSLFEYKGPTEDAIVGLGSVPTDEEDSIDDADSVDGFHPFLAAD